MVAAVAAAADIPALLAGVNDPEIPELSITDLGIVRDWRSDRARHCHIVLTPTYSGCPAYETISDDIRSVLAAAGYDDITIEKRYSPPWSTDWLSARARETLRQIGIAPPQTPAPQHGSAHEAIITLHPRRVACPRCRSTNTELISAFASTACKAHHRCLDCLEPFDEFKAI